MKVPLFWLKEYLDLRAFSLQEISNALTLGGLEVDAIETANCRFSGIVVGKIIEAQPHPNADRLRIATVSDGREQFQVVCGAPNCRAGIMTAFAKVGAAITDAEGKVHKIKKSKLRDVESFGMLCSEKELGLTETLDGIMELPEHCAEGDDLASLYSDTVFEISLTPNLGHCFSIIGIARELSALLNIPLKRSAFTVQEDPKLKIDQFLQVSLIDKKQCLRYSCRLVKDVQIGPSPDWLKKRLESCGLRSINNVVDIGNLVMLELGQPLHMFDYEKLGGKKIIVTTNTGHQKIETLDDMIRDIPEESLLICDEERPLAFAGVMGGKFSSVNENTRNVLIESAIFTPQSIRKTSKLLGLRTDSAQRFERGIDPNGVVTALDRAAQLLHQLAHGHIAQGVIDQKAYEFEPKKIACRLHRVNQILGTTLSLREVSSLFSRLEIAILKEEHEQLLVSPPSYRNDLLTEIDLIEEVARIYGYNLIPKKPPLHISSAIGDAPIYLFEKQARANLLSEGLQEFVTCDLISPAQADLVKEPSLSSDALISVLQPRSIEQSILRPTMLAGLLQAVKYNRDRQNDNISGFEVGRIHFKEGSQHKEQSVAAIILSGNVAPYHFDPKPREVDFFDLKGMIENLLGSYKLKDVQLEPSHLHNFHPGRQARIKIAGVAVGAMGEVHPLHVQKLDIGQKVYFAEINLHDLYPLVKKGWKVCELSLYPGSERDWTITVKDEVPAQRLLDAIKASAPPLMEKVQLLDLYKSAQIGKDRKNVTLRFVYRDPLKTVSLETVEKEHAKLTQDVAEKLKDSIV